MQIVDAKDARMSKTAVQSPVVTGSSPSIDRFVIPLMSCAYAVILAPMLVFLTAGLPTTFAGMTEVRNEHKIFWPTITVIALFLAVRHRSRFDRRVLQPHIVCLLAYVGLAAFSVVWAFNPAVSLTRLLQQAMVITSVVLPALLAGQAGDMMRGLFLCYACAVLLNVFCVSFGSEMIINDIKLGYPGYFQGKNMLGQFAGVALLLCWHEFLYPGLRRASGIAVAAMAVYLLYWGNSKTALGLSILVPCLAGLVLMARRATRLSLAIILLSIPITYIIATNVVGFGVNRISYMLYGDSSFTGRTTIWDFAHFEIARRPLLGWGYQSFWFVGPEGPALVDAPGWVKFMPNAHNGYLDTILETGFVGLAFLLAFILATLHSIGAVADRNPARAWLLLSLALFVIITNFMESTWFRAFELLWIVFLLVAAETARSWQGVDSAHQSRTGHRILAARVAGGHRMRSVPLRMQSPRSTERRIKSPSNVSSFRRELSASRIGANIERSRSISGQPQEGSVGKKHIERDYESVEFRKFREKKYFSELDVLRGFSILAVVYYHTVPSYFAHFGSNGVTLFFAISGFLITTIILRSKNEDGSFGIRNFYVRRSLRIWPLYYAVLLLYILAVLLFERDALVKQQFFYNLKYFATFTSNWFVAYDQPRVIFYLAWSLAAEEQFYLVWPWVERYLKGVQPALVAGFIVLCTSAAAVLAPSSEPNLLMTIVVGIPPAICCGVILGHLLNKPSTFSAIYLYAGRPASAFMAVQVTLAAVVLLPDAMPLKGTLVALATAFLVATCVVREDNIFTKLSGIRPLMLLGGVSYGVYLLHMLVLNGLRRCEAVMGLSSPLLLFLGTTIVSTLLASLIYRYYERPFIALKDRWTI